MGVVKKVTLGVVSLVPIVLLDAAVYALFAGDDAGAFVIASITVSGVVDTALAPFFIPHVHDNPRLSSDRKLLWIVALGIPFFTVAPLYWALHMVREAPAAARQGAPGGAWYPDPWGQAPFRWWDGERWTDWVTGPPVAG
jgi:hypothetical protein